MIVRKKKEIQRAINEAGISEMNALRIVPFHQTMKNMESTINKDKTIHMGM